MVNKSENMDWYKGSTLMYHLETVHISSDYNHVDCRFPIQSVIRPHTLETKILEVLLVELMGVFLNLVIR